MTKLHLTLCAIVALTAPIHALAAETRSMSTYKIFKDERNLRRVRSEQKAQIHVKKADAADAHHSQQIRIKDIDLLAEHMDKLVAQNHLLRTYISRILAQPSVSQSELEWYVESMNKIPGFDVKYTLRNREKGSAYDSAELVLDISRTKARLYIDARNGGSDALGKRIYSATAQVFGVTKGGADTILLSGLTTDKPKAMTIGTVGYMRRLNSYGTTFSLVMSNLHSVHNHATESISEKSTVYKGELEQYLLLNFNSSLKLELGIELHKMEDQDIPTLGKYRHTDGYLGLKFRHTCPRLNNASTEIHAIYSQSLTDVKTASGAALPASMDPRFSVVKIDARHHQPLMGNFAALVAANYQWANAKLPLEEQWLFGGAHLGRGYREGFLNGQGGWAASLELRYNKHFGASLLESAQPYAFVEFAGIKNPEAVLTKKSFDSYGAGLRLALPWTLSANFEWAKPMKSVVSVNGVSEKLKDNFAISISKEFKI